MKKRSVAPQAAVDVAGPAGGSVKSLRVVTLWWNRFRRLLQAEAPEPPRSCSGGILADDMGMGKHLDDDMDNDV